MIRCNFAPVNLKLGRMEENFYVVLFMCALVGNFDKIMSSILLVFIFTSLEALLAKKMGYKNKSR